MGYALKNSQTFEEESCIDCGIVFYVPDLWQRTRRNSKANFYCPNGHSMAYTESEADRLKRQLDERDRQLAWEKQRAETLDRRLKQEAGKHQALKRRVAAGVCPCCQRTVRQLAAHMRTKHPGYIGDGVRA